MPPFTKYCLFGLTLISNLSMAAQVPSYPCLQLINGTDDNLRVENDPNWDDLLLLVDGKLVVHDLERNLANNEKISLCGYWYQFGLHLYPHANFVALSVENNDSSGVTHFANIYQLNYLNYSVLVQSSSYLEVRIY